MDSFIISSKIFKKKVIFNLKKIKIKNVRKDDFVIRENEIFKLTEIEINKVTIRNNEITTLLSLLDAYLRGLLTGIEEDFFKLVFYKDKDKSKRVDIKIIFDEDRKITFNKLEALHLLKLTNEITKQYPINHFKY